MALKKKITKEEHAKLSEGLKGEYKADGDNFILDVEGEEDTGALKRAKDHEANARKEAEKNLKEAQDKLAALEDETSKKKGDIPAIEASWQLKVDAEKAAHKATTEKYQGAFKKRLVDAEATTIATKISKVPSLLSRVIKDRLSIDFDGDEPSVRVLDKDGKASALTIADLEKELVANPDFKDIIIASKSSGGAGKTTQNGGAGTNNPDKPADLAAMNPTDLASRMGEIIAERKSAQE